MFQELIEVHKELVETKERMVKENIAVETEYNENQCERNDQKLCLLQEKGIKTITKAIYFSLIWFHN